MDQLNELGAEVEYHDPYVPVVGPTRDHIEWQGKQSVPWSEDSIASFDAVLISTWHDCFDSGELADWAELIVDTRNAMANATTKSGQLFKA